MEVFGKSDIGQVRATNQDACRFGKLSDTVLFAVVCDGMGGASGGNVASCIAADIVANRIENQYRDNMPQASVFNLLESAVAAANIEVFDRAAADTALAGMGTTLVAVVVDGGHVMAAHVGDSRLYRFHNGAAEQITVDHSVVQEMIEKGQITAAEARNHPRKHFITRAVGVEAAVQCDFSGFSLEDGDRLLICTDGLTNMLSDGELAETVAKASPETLADTLVDAANRAGGEDNITAVIIA